MQSKSDTKYSDEASLIIDGEAALEEILSSIHQARESIRICMYMWRDDRSGNLVLDALIEKIRIHPEMYIIIEKDTLGTLAYTLEKYLRLWKIGGDIFFTTTGKQFLKSKNVLFHYVWTWWPWDLRYKRENNHSKIFLFDEFSPSANALVWGMNISDQHLNPHFHPDPKKSWLHDYMVKINGDLADYLVHEVHKKPSKWFFNHLKNGIEIFMTLKSRHKMRLQILEELGAARKSIIIEQGTITDKTVIKHLRKISRKWVHITIIVPSKSVWTSHANMRSLHMLLEPSLIDPVETSNIEVYLYPKKLHAKAILIDDSTAIIWSANLTYGSFDFLHETSVIFRDASLVARDLSSQLWKDREISRKVTYATLPSFRRVLAWLQMIFI
jgi:cardiolipin synthase A/B